MITRSIDIVGIIVIISLKEPVALIPRQCRDYNLQRDRDVIVTKRRGEFLHRLARIIVQSVASSSPARLQDFISERDRFRSQRQ